MPENISESQKKHPAVLRRQLLRTRGAHLREVSQLVTTRRCAAIVSVCPPTDTWPAVSLLGRSAAVWSGSPDLVEDPPRSAAVTPDPDDDYLVALARETPADYVVSGDRHLLGLADPVPPMLTPRQFLDMLGA